MVGKFRQMHGDISVTLADVPDAVRPQAAEREESNFTRLSRLGEIVNAKPAGELLVLESITRFSSKIGFLADLHGPDAWRVDGEQEIAMGLQVTRAGVRRTCDKLDRIRPSRIAHVDHRNTVGKAVADIGKALVDHDLHAIAAAALVGVAKKFDIARGDRIHAKILPDGFAGTPKARARKPGSLIVTFLET